MALQLAYIGLSLVMALILFFMGSYAVGKAFSAEEAKKKRVKLMLGLLAWNLYILALGGGTTVLQNFDFPPRFALLLILPAFVFTGIFAYRNRNEAWLQAIPQHWLLYYQSFRVLIETIFVFSVAQGILHYHVTIEGYNYDMVFGFLTLIVTYLIFQQNVLSKRMAVLWNYVGLAVIGVIIFLFLSTIYLPELYGGEAGVPLAPMAMTTYPYILVAGFLMPSAVFVHVLSIVQLTHAKA